MKTGDLIALDGREGHVISGPVPKSNRPTASSSASTRDLRDRLIENRDQVAVTRDGVQMELLANVNSPPDAEMAAKAGACGVGLYRTGISVSDAPDGADRGRAAWRTRQ